MTVRWTELGLLTCCCKRQHTPEELPKEGLIKGKNRIRERWRRGNIYVKQCSDQFEGSTDISEGTNNKPGLRSGLKVHLETTKLG